MMSDLRIAVCGAGAMGANHIGAIDAAKGAELCAVAEPGERRPIPGTQVVPWFTTLDALIAAEAPDGVVIATPNAAHLEAARVAIDARCPVLIEKPLAATLDEGRQIVAAAEEAGLVCAVGHHRRHSAAVALAQEVIAAGTLGNIRAVQCTAWLAKPANYFDLPWRTKPGAGPVLLNLIHDIDTLRALLGEVAWVSAQVSPSRRGHAVEDTAAVILSFRSGALATIGVSDTVAGPWSWELTAGENPMYPETSESAVWIGGDRAALSLPNATLWEHDGGASWTAPLNARRLAMRSVDPLVAQMENFVAAIRGTETVKATARDGWATLAVVDAIMRAAEGSVTVEPQTLDA